MATATTTVGIASTGDFVTTTLNGAISDSATTATIGTGLNIPAANGFLQLDPDSTTAVGSDNGPETVKYATYTSGTGALTGLTRGADANTSGVAHANGCTVHAGISALHLNNLTDIIENSAWSSWTPTFGNFTAGSATITSKYFQLGKLVWFYITVTLSSSTMGSSPTFTLPVTASSAFPKQRVFYGHIVDAGTDHFQATGILTNTTTVELVTNTAGSTYVGYAQVTSTAPMTWADNDVFTITGFYEAA